jgi:hypothetical protein
MDFAERYEIGGGKTATRLDRPALCDADMIGTVQIEHADPAERVFVTNARITHATLNVRKWHAKLTGDKIPSRENLRLHREAAPMG